MRISGTKYSRATHVILSVIALAMIAGPLQAAETKDKTEDSTTQFCETYRTQMGHSSRDDTVLIICPEGLAYKTASMQVERMIPWRQIDRWRYHGPEGKEADPGSGDYSILRVVPSGG